MYIINKKMAFKKREGIENILIQYDLTFVL